MKAVLCRVGRTSLVAAVLDRGTPPVWMAGHIDKCLSCQALAANARRLRRDLAQPPPDAAAIDLVGSPDPSSGRTFKLVGVALAVVAWATLRARSEGADRRMPSFLSPAFAVYSSFRRTP